MSKSIELPNITDIRNGAPVTHLKMEIRGVKVGQKFTQGKNIICEVVDFQEIVSLRSSIVVGHFCIAKNVGGFANNEFQVPFSTVVRNRI